MTDGLFAVGLAAVAVGVCLLWGYPVACIVGGCLLLCGAVYRQTVTDPAQRARAQAAAQRGEVP